MELSKDLLRGALETVFGQPHLQRIRARQRVEEIVSLGDLATDLAHVLDESMNKPAIRKPPVEGAILIYEYHVQNYNCPANFTLHVGWKWYKQDKKWAAWWVSPWPNPFVNGNVTGLPGGTLDGAMPGTWIARLDEQIIVDSKDDLIVEKLAGPGPEGPNGFTTIRLWAKRKDPAAQLYRVKFSRPDGTEGWLGQSHRGPTSDASKSPAISLAEANFCAQERNRVHGPSGFRYWVVPADEGTPAA